MIVVIRNGAFRFRVVWETYVLSLVSKFSLRVFEVHVSGLDMIGHMIYFFRRKLHTVRPSILTV